VHVDILGHVLSLLVMPTEACSSCKLTNMAVTILSPLLVVAFTVHCICSFSSAVCESAHAPAAVLACCCRQLAGWTRLT
jgi:hypothetical protein